MSVRVALVGCGAWGQNILRVLTESPRARLVAVADPSPARRAVAAVLAPAASAVPSIDEALATGVAAVLVAAPPHAHAGLVLRALAAGADVFVEKPLATRVADAERCASSAAALGRVAMVGHLLRYHPAVERLLDLARDGALGRILGMESSRLCVAAGRRAAASALWTLGPHDLSVLLALDASPFEALSASMGPGGDPVVVDADLASGLSASIVLSRVAPIKERRLRVVGSAGAAVFDDVRAPDRLLVGGAEVRVPWQEPLALEIEHFLRCVEERARPRTPFDDGLTVVRALAQAEQSLVSARYTPAQHPHPHRQGAEARASAEARCPPQAPLAHGRAAEDALGCEDGHLAVP